MARTRGKHPFEVALAKAIAARRTRLRMSKSQCVERMRADRDVRAYYGDTFHNSTWLSWESLDPANGRTPPFAMLPAIARVLQFDNVRDLIPCRKTGSKANRVKRSHHGAVDGGSV